MVIADTSLWIEYFKGGDEPARAALRKLIRTEQVVLVGVVLAELLQGCRSSHEARTIISNLTALPFLETGFSTWKRAGELSASLQQKGVTLPLSDLIIGAPALEHRYQVYTFDAHVRLIPGPKLYAPPRSSAAR